MTGAPLRVLVLHNRHRSAVPSGENRAVDYEVELLRRAGVDVETHEPSNDDIDSWPLLRRATVARRPLWSPEQERAVARIADDFRPDVVHLHNPFPLLTPRVLRAGARKGAATVQTVHNYLHACVAGTHLRDGQRCFDCCGRAFPWPAVQHACYHDSRAQSAVLGAALVAARPVWRTVDRFLPVSRAVADRLEADGIAASRITVKHNAVPDPGPSQPPGRDFLFAARLRAEKGLERLLAAWQSSGVATADGGGGAPRLRIAGDGPQRALAQSAAQRIAGVDYIGPATPDQVAELMRKAGVVLLPSIWDEPLPLTAIEALSHGRALIVSRRGGLADLVDSEVGWAVEDGVEPLAAALAEAARSDLAAIGARARRRYTDRLGPDILVRQLLSIYAELRKPSSA